MRSSGLHHVTALSSDPQATLDFYAGVLGMRLVKRTVNFDAPTVHHFYFGDARGRPGTLLTFFPFPDARQGRPGAGQVTRIALAVPGGSLGAWEERLRERGTDDLERSEGPAGEDALALADPDGLGLLLVEAPRPGPGDPASDDGALPAEHAVRGLARVTLLERERGPTAEVLETLGFRSEDLGDGRWRFGPEGGGPVEGCVELEVRPGASPGEMSAGCVHHVAFRAADDRAQREARSLLLEGGFRVTPVLDRRYFRSIYFREPGGVLFEVATDGPGFDLDEPVDALGSGLRLPPWLEDRREELEAALPPVEVLA